jgi:hypothetical protein
LVAAGSWEKANTQVAAIIKRTEKNFDIDIELLDLNW